MGMFGAKEFAQQIEMSTHDKFYCQLAAIRGHELRNDPNNMHQADFYTMLMKDSEQNKGIRNISVRKDGFVVFEFNSETEQNNFVNYLKTDFARFCLSIVKNTQNIHYGENGTYTLA